ncbi:hypothetical protein RFI_27355 [Reticulomyxa filosa]|uniref:Uncharacterized protein n=1 Tax=Reticulomyxa filosa TaxID=46433 RepID=X6M967_RETFI|nr:hypothetical protein RFI_27355 [Reticulomyxa filosa]|eukprot:ETO10022.1 hypothetical protein RFI_27355 [Reticulomyxa filosa]
MYMYIILPKYTYIRTHSHLSICFFFFKKKIIIITMDLTFDTKTKKKSNNKNQVCKKTNKQTNKQIRNKQINKDSYVCIYYIKKHSIKFIKESTLCMCMYVCVCVCIVFLLLLWSSPLQIENQNESVAIDLQYIFMKHALDKEEQNSYDVEKCDSDELYIDLCKFSSFWNWFISCCHLMYELRHLWDGIDQRALARRSQKKASLNPTSHRDIGNATIVSSEKDASTEHNDHNLALSITVPGVHETSSTEHNKTGAEPWCATPSIIRNASYSDQAIVHIPARLSESEPNTKKRNSQELHILNSEEHNLDEYHEKSKSASLPNEVEPGTWNEIPSSRTRSNSHQQEDDNKSESEDEERSASNRSLSKDKPSGVTSFKNSEPPLQTVQLDFFMSREICEKVLQACPQGII